MKHHTFRVSCGFSMDHTFVDADIGPDGEPTDEAIEKLSEELEAYLGENYCIEGMDVDTDFLIGIAEDNPKALPAEQ